MAQRVRPKPALPQQNTPKEHLFPLDLIAPLVAYKFFIYGFVFLSLALLPPFFNLNGYNKNFHWPADAQPSLATMFSTWDAQMHLHLSHEGYDQTLMSVNHQPLWPFLIRVFSSFTLGNHLIAGLILSNLFSLMGFCLFHKLARDDGGERVANIALALLVAFPGALFFSFVYTESLFLCLAVVFIMSLKRSNYLAAAAAAFFLPLTRVIGVFCIFPFAWHLYRNRGSPVNWFYCGSPVLGMLVYFLIMYFYTGDPFSGIEGAQRYASAASLTRLFDLGQFFGDLFSPVRFSHTVLNSVFDRFWFLCFVLTVGFIWKINSTYFVYSLFMGLVPAMTSSFMSYTRYLVVVFPLFLAAAKLFANLKRDYWLWFTIAVLFSLQMIFLLRHVNYYWFA
jgi:hypothetical protein